MREKYIETYTIYIPLKYLYNNTISVVLCRIEYIIIYVILHNATPIWVLFKLGWLANKKGPLFSSDPYMLNKI